MAAGRFGLLVLALVLLSGISCSALLLHTGPIPARALLVSSYRDQPRISPDGSTISMLVGGWGRASLRLLPTDPGQLQQSFEVPPECISHLWARDGERIFLITKVKDREYHLNELKLSTGKIRRLSPGVRHRVTGLQGRRDGLFVTFSDRRNGLSDAYRYDYRTESLTLLMKNPAHALRYMVDDQWQVRALVVYAQAGRRRLLVRRDPQAIFDTLREWSAAEMGNLLDISEAGRWLYFLDFGESDTRKLVRFDLLLGRTEEVYRDPKADLPGDLLLVHGKVVALVTEGQRRRWRALTPRLAKDFEILAKAGGGDPIKQITWSQDQSDWVVTFASDVNPGRVFHYHRPTGRSRLIARSNPLVVTYRQAPMRPLVLRARDGLPLVSYLTLPHGYGTKHLPLVLLVHGGPFSRDHWQWDPWVQFLASRGYAVLQVNYRGSVGFGRRFLAAGFRELGRHMQRDLWDATRWAIRTGLADPRRIAIMGASFGGFSTLVGLTFQPELYRAGIALAARSNLATLVAQAEERTPDFGRFTRVAVGEPTADSVRLRLQSPIYRAAHLRSPLLLLHGDQDAQVPLEQSASMVRELRARGKGRLLRYVVYAGEGHGLASSQNVMDFLHRVEHFLQRHLGGEVEFFWTRSPHRSSAKER